VGGRERSTLFYILVVTKYMIDMPKNQLSKLQVGLAGEHLVVGQLFLRGYIATMTLKNYPGVDIFVLNPKTKKQTAVQVKTIRSGKLYYVPENVGQDEYPFVFVHLKYPRGAEIPASIDYYIISARARA